MSKKQDLPAVLESQSPTKEIFPGLGFDIFFWIIIIFFLFGGFPIFGLGINEKK
ncbi:hypothetical protein [Thermotalea metallivorans]|uniref:Uncharacterized protein n=1 Tax=Thermotalea metallivorans TaxID=520762 RepID=A0A140L391_9FIRM|nr:hypothetical protein [Thermotalea metallivorans]KXG75016.1 hypothetical protein AN619_19860 [Thermotalea metallivorans]